MRCSQERRVSQTASSQAVSTRRHRYSIAQLAGRRGDRRQIVAIDDQSLNQIGQWPWPRGIVAQLVDKLRDAGAGVVVFDILFAEPDRTSPQSLIPILAAARQGASA